MSKVSKIIPYVECCKELAAMRWDELLAILEERGESEVWIERQKRKAIKLADKMVIAQSITYADALARILESLKSNQQEKEKDMKKCLQKSKRYGILYVTREEDCI